MQVVSLVQSLHDGVESVDVKVGLVQCQLLDVASFFAKKIRKRASLLLVELQVLQEELLD